MPTAVQSAVHLFIQTLLIFIVLRVEIVPNVTLHVLGSPAMHQPRIKQIRLMIVWVFGGHSDRRIDIQLLHS